MMIGGGYDMLKDIASRNICAEHKAPLEVAWYSKEKCYALRCGGGTHTVLNEGPSEGVYLDSKTYPGHYPDAVTRQLSLTEEMNAGADIPEPIKSNIIKRQRRKAMIQGKQLPQNQFALIPQADLATGELLPQEAIDAILSYARKYNLDPYRGHVVIMYGKPYIGLDGYLYHARQEGKPYTLKSRPMTTEELKQYKVGETDHGWLAEVSFTDTGDTFNGVGIVTYEEMTAKSPRDPSKLRSPVVAAHPWQLAQKRAEWQALRRAFPIGEATEKEEV